MRTNPDPRGRRSVTEVARREQIVGAAIAVLASDGYAATSLGAIAESLGISKGVISYHFAGKAELLGEVVSTVLDRAAQAMTPAVQAATTFRQALEVYIAANLTFISRHRDDVVAMTEVLLNDRASSESFAHSQQEAVSALEALVTGGIHAGEFAEVPARATAISLRASIDAATGLLRSDPAFDVDAFGADLMALYSRLVAGAGAGAGAEAGVGATDSPTASGDTAGGTTGARHVTGEH